MGIGEATLYNEKKKHSGLDAPELLWLNQLVEKTQYKQLVANLGLDKQRLPDVLKKVLKSVQRWHAAQVLIDAYRISVRRARRIIGLQRANWAYEAHSRNDTVLRLRVREYGLAQRAPPA